MRESYVASRYIRRVSYVHTYTAETSPVRRPVRSMRFPYALRLCVVGAFALARAGSEGGKQDRSNEWIYLQLGLRKTQCNIHMHDHCNSSNSAE
jgi:hypothetical protein